MPSRLMGARPLLLLSVALGGCSICTPAAQIRELVRLPSEVVPAPQIDSFYLAAYEVGEAEQRTVFGRTLEPQGVLAVRIEMENMGADDVTLDLGDAFVRTDAGDSLEPMTRLDVQERISISRWRAALGIPLLIFPAFIYWGQITDCNTALEMFLAQDAQSAESFSIRTNRNGDNALRRYIFFRLSRGAPRQLVVSGYRGDREDREQNAVQLEVFLRRDL